MARLTTAQLSTLKGNLAANTTTVVIGGTTFQIKDIGVDDRSDEAANAVVAVYNALAAGSYKIWDSLCSKIAIKNLVVAANYTPSDAADNTVTYQNRAILCQLKQENAVWLLTSSPGDTTLDASLLSVRQNLKDFLTAIPSGTAGASQDAGWGTAGSPGVVRLALQRNATVGGKLLGSAVGGNGPGNVVADARGSTTNPDLPGVDNNGVAIITLTSTDVKDAWSS